MRPSFWSTFVSNCWRTTELRFTDPRNLQISSSEKNAFDALLYFLPYFSSSFQATMWCLIASDLIRFKPIILSHRKIMNLVQEDQNFWGTILEADKQKRSPLLNHGNVTVSSRRIGALWRKNFPYLTVLWSEKNLSTPTPHTISPHLNATSFEPL